MRNWVGQRISNYELTVLLGRGGFGEVYLAKQVYIGTYVAIKILRATFAQKGDEERFRKEAKILAQLRHPHIIRILDYGVNTDQNIPPHIIMELAERGTLRTEHPKGDVLALSTVLAYVKQIGEALQHAHTKGIIHGDVKPENILVNADNQLLLSDFGIAIQTVSAQPLSPSFEPEGTLTYMAPERFHGRALPESDQYSLAVIVYEWLCGTPPFVGRGAMEFAVQHNSVLPTPLREHVPALPQEVDTVVQTALAKEPERRYPSVQEFVRFLTEAGSMANPPVKIVRSGKVQDEIDHKLTNLEEAAFPAGEYSPKRALELYRDAIRSAWKDRVIQPEEKRYLEQVPGRLRLSKEDAEWIEKSILPDILQDVFYAQSRYRQEVMLSWRDQSLQADEIEELISFAQELKLTEREVQGIETEEMGATKEAILAKQQQNDSGNAPTTQKKGS